MIPETTNLGRTHVTSSVDSRNKGGLAGQAHAEDFVYVNNLRFWSMFAVVAIHSSQVFFETGDGHLPLVQVLHTPLKFATFAFFLVSGFLAGRCLESPRPVSYLKRRLKRVGGPWLLWILVTSGGLLLRDLFHHRIPLAMNREVLAAIVSHGRYSLLHTAFWFVPNLMLSLALLLLFRRFHKDLRFGAVLMSFSLLYAANVYGAWVPDRHSEAVLGFVFYVWLGSYTYYHQEAFGRWLARVSYARLWIALALSGVLAYAESALLYRMDAPDPLNSLRLSNQIFSCVAVLILYKLDFAAWPRFVDVRRHTFGIYLTHSLVLLSLWPCLRSREVAPVITRLSTTTVGLVALWMAVTLAAYGTSLLLTKCLAAQRFFSWMVGMSAPRREGT